MNSHNRKDDCEYVNIQTRKDKQGDNVQFTKQCYKISRTFKDLNIATEFRDIIQLKINNNVNYLYIYIIKKIYVLIKIDIIIV
jgi:hypothetical protein